MAATRSAGAAFDALVFGYYLGDKLIYAARTRNGFTPTGRDQHEEVPAVETTECPFANLPEASSGRWGQGLTAAKMKDCRWLKPMLIGQFEFRGVDSGQSCPAFTVCGVAGRQESERSEAGSENVTIVPGRTRTSLSKNIKDRCKATQAAMA